MSWQDVDALLNRVEHLLSPEGYRSMLLYVGNRVGTLAESYGRTVPPSPNGRPLNTFYTLDGKPSKFKSRKQRGWFFASLKKGKLKLPYKRTGFLPNSITHKVLVEGKGVIVIVGTNMKGAKFVIGAPDVQSHYHKETGWLSLPKEINDHDRDIHDEIVRAVNGYVRGYVRGK